MAGLDSAIGDLFVKIKPDTKGFGKDVANATAGSTNRALGGVQKASRIGLTAVLAVGTGLAAVGKEADAAFDNIRTGTGATGEALKGLEDDFKSLLAEVPASSEDAGIAIANLNTALGVTGDDVVLLGENFLELSRITGTDLETNIASATEALNNFQIGPAFGDSAKETEGVLDNLFRVSQATGVGVDELGNQLARSGAQFRAVGLDINDSAALIGTLGKAGIDATQVVPGLTRVLKDAADEGITAEEAFANVSDAIVNATSDSEAMNLAFEAFGTRGGAVLGEQIRNGTLDLAEMNKTWKDSEDSILGVAEDTKSFQERLLELKNKVFVSLEPAATKLFTSLGDSMESLTPAIVMVVDAIVPLIELFASLPAPVQAAIIGALVMGSVLTKLVKPIMGVIKVLKLLSAAVMTNPWILLIVAVVALAVIIYKNWDKIKGYVEDALDAIIGFFEGWWDTAKGLWDSIVGWFTDIWDSISGVVTKALDVILAILQPFVDAFTAIFSFAFNAMSTFIESWTGRLTALFENLFQWLTTAFETVRDVIMAIWQPFWDAVTAVVEIAVGIVTKYFNVALAVWTAIFTTAWDVIKAIFTTAWDIISGIVETAVGVVRGLLDTLLAPIGGISGALETMKDVFQTVWDGVKEIMQKAYDFVVDLAGKIGDAVSDALGPVGDIAGAVGGVLGGGARLLGFDEGGVVPGPKGSEQIIMAHGGETILPTHKKPIPMLEGASATGGGSGSQIVIQGPLLSIDGPVNIRNDQDIVELSRSLADDANRELRATGKVGNAS